MPSDYYDNRRNKIFTELHQVNALIANKLSDFRGFCKLFFDSNKEDILRFFNKDIEVQTLYLDISK